MQSRVRFSIESTGDFPVRVPLKSDPNGKYVNSIQHLSTTLHHRDGNSDTKISLKTYSLFQSRGLACAVTSLLIVAVTGEKKIDGRGKNIAGEAQRRRRRRAQYRLDRELDGGIYTGEKTATRNGRD